MVHSALTGSAGARAAGEGRGRGEPSTGKDKGGRRLYAEARPHASLTYCVKQRVRFSSVCYHGNPRFSPQNLAFVLSMHPPAPAPGHRASGERGDSNRPPDTDGIDRTMAESLPGDQSTGAASFPQPLSLATQAPGCCVLHSISCYCKKSRFLYLLGTYIIPQSPRCPPLRRRTLPQLAAQQWLHPQRRPVHLPPPARLRGPDSMASEPQGPGPQPLHCVGRL